MRRLLIACALVIASSVLCQDAPSPAPVSQAVKALEYLKPQANGGPTSWTNGPYAYDGAGNITATGSEAYVYDKIGRLKSATVRGPDLSSMQTQSFEYDHYGNLISTSKLGQTVLLPTSAATNQLGALHYDASGNVDVAGTQHYGYDALGMVNAVGLGATLQPRIIYAYTADDERLFAFDVSTGITHWTLRGFDNKVLRDFRQQGSTWAVERDYVYRDGLLLAALKASGAVEHYSLDHLGTPRFITDSAGHRIGHHVYWPFGEEWSPGSAQDASPLKYTGHERDADPAGGSAPLDYMHARYYSAGWGRFLSVDPVLNLKRVMARPQGWNRYAYVEANPVNKTDPDGRCLLGILVCLGLHYLEKAGVIEHEKTLDEDPAARTAAFTREFEEATGPGYPLQEDYGTEMAIVAPFTSWVTRAGAAAELTLGRKLDYLFDRNINPANVHSAARAAGNAAVMRNAGIMDSAANRVVITQRMNAALSDSSTVVARQGTRITRQIYIMGERRATGAILEFVEQGGRVISITAKSAK